MAAKESFTCSAGIDMPPMQYSHYCCKAAAAQSEGGLE